MGVAATMTKTITGTLATSGRIIPRRKSALSVATSSSAADFDSRGKSAVMMETAMKACGSMKMVKATV